MTQASYTVQKTYDAGFQSVKAKELADSIFGLANINANYGLTATPSGTYLTSLQLTGGINEVSTVASASDGVKLPPAAPGTILLIAASAASNDGKLFSYEGSTVTINGTSGATGITLTHGKQYLVFCVSPTKWFTILTA